MSALGQNENCCCAKSQNRHLTSDLFRIRDYIFPLFFPLHLCEIGAICGYHVLLQCFATISTKCRKYAPGAFTPVPPVPKSRREDEHDRPSAHPVCRGAGCLTPPGPCEPPAVLASQPMAARRQTAAFFPTPTRPLRRFTPFLRLPPPVRKATHPPPPILAPHPPCHTQSNPIQPNRTTVSPTKSSPPPWRRVGRPPQIYLPPEPPALRSPHSTLRILVTPTHLRLLGYPIDSTDPKL
jgi:hypothetical protein